MAKYWIGIDPGLSGAVAMIEGDAREGDRGFRGVYDAPTKPRPRSTRRVYDVERVVKLFTAVPAHEREQCTAILETSTAMPGQGVSSMFMVGYGAGMYEMALRALGFRLRLVTPQQWKKVMLPRSKRDKDEDRYAGLRKARRLFPKAELHLSKHDGRADALLIAEYGRLTEPVSLVDYREYSS